MCQAEHRTLRFVDEAADVLFIDPPGVGKTMLAVALGHAAVDAGSHASDTTAADLAARCHRAALAGRWRTTRNFFAAPQVLIIDELDTGRWPAKPPPRSRHRIDALLTLRRLADRARRGHTPTRLHRRLIHASTTCWPQVDGWRHAALLLSVDARKPA